MIRNLRDYLNVLQEKGWLDTVSQPTPIETLSSRMKEQEKKERTVLFESVPGYEGAMVNNLFANRDFLAVLFDCPKEDVVSVFSQRYEQRIKPVMVEKAPVQ